jgi:hypothetical protein
MILKIDKKDMGAIEQAAAEHNCYAQFYTIENNDLMVQCEITDQGKEITLLIAYAIGRISGMQKMSNALIK